MKIVYVGAFRLPNKDAAAPRVLNNAKIFQALGNKVFFISWGGEYRAEDCVSDGVYTLNGSRYFITNEIDCTGNLIKKILSRVLRGRKSLKILANMVNQFDSIVLYNADFFFTLIMLLFCKIHKKKLINDITEWYAFNELNLFAAFFNCLNMSFLQYMVRNKIVISSFLDNYYKKSNNLVLPPLCDLNDSKWQKDVADNRVPEFDGITLIYAGNPGKKDNIHIAIYVINKLIKSGCKVRFLILGISKQSYMNRYGKFLNDVALHDNIVFLGRISQDLVPAYYKKADFMVLFRDVNRKNTAGFPTKFAESMVAGVPVISNRTSDIPNFIINGKNGFLVDNINIDGLTSFFEDNVLRLDRIRINEMKCAVQKSRDNFFYRSYESQTQSFFDRMI